MIRSGNKKKSQNLYASVLRVLVFLRCAIPCDAITAVVICTLLPSVVTADDLFSERVARAIAWWEYLTRF